MNAVSILPKKSKSPLSLVPSSRYRLVSRIASGGMGAVYIGMQRGAAGFKRPVAIKRAHAYLLQDPSFRDCILEEARNASVVRHTNVVSIDDVEDAGGELLLVMSYVEGTSLSHVLADRRGLTASIVARVMVDICAGLHAIHTAKNESGRALELVHRDVSPQNILVDTDGVARIADFGIAKGNLAARSTRTGMRRGKLGYMAPEYVTAMDFSPRSDVFGLGVVLWEALTGEALFKDKPPVDALMMALEGRTPDPSSVNPLVPRSLDPVLRRCLAPSPEARYASARELGEAIEAAVPRLADREVVGKLVSLVAARELDAQRAAIEAARFSRRPPSDEMVEESGEYRVSPRSLLPFEPREADISGTGTSELEDGDIVESFVAPAPPPLPERSLPPVLRPELAGTNIASVGLFPRFELPSEAALAAAPLPQSRMPSPLGVVRRPVPGGIPAQSLLPPPTIVVEEPTPPRAKPPGRTWGSIALATVILTVVLGSTAVLVDLGLSEDTPAEAP